MAIAGWEGMFVLIGRTYGKFIKGSCNIRGFEGAMPSGSALESGATGRCRPGMDWVVQSWRAAQDRAVDESHRCGGVTWSDEYEIWRVEAAGRDGKTLSCRRSGTIRLSMDDAQS